MITEEKLTESIIRIENFVLSNYKDCQDSVVFETICSTLGLKKLYKNNKEILTKSLQLYLFSKFISKFSINFEKEVKSMKIEQLQAITGRIGVSTNEAINPAIITAGKTYVSNFVKQYGSSTIVETQIPEVDNYFKYSVVVRKLYNQIESLNDLAKLQFVQVVRYLVSKTEFIRSLIRKQNGTRFKVNNQDILSDYFYELETSNLKIHKMINKLEIVPYLLELNGKPGVGKSTFVDYFSELIQQLLPFYSGAEVLYTRVNDKFWNGYKQQPLVLYDDSNQNKKLLYDLDNEIIMIGGGKFVYPPMAFEKDTKFSSIFVIFTTNKPILQTTKVDKGAVARRINTYTVRPVETLGNWQQSNLGEYWQYNDDVIESPFNITFNNMNYLTIFSKLILKQMDKLSKKNVSNCPFSILQQTKRQMTVETIQQRLISYRKYLGLDNKFNKIDDSPFDFSQVIEIEFPNTALIGSEIAHISSFVVESNVQQEIVAKNKLGFLKFEPNKVHQKLDFMVSRWANNKRKLANGEFSFVDRYQLADIVNKHDNQVPAFNPLRKNYEGEYKSTSLNTYLPEFSSWAGHSQEFYIIEKQCTTQGMIVYLRSRITCINHRDYYIDNVSYLNKF